jgi:hypothetical protein
LWSTTAKAEDEDEDHVEEEELAPQTPLAASKASACRACIGREAEVSGGWQKVLPETACAIQHRRHQFWFPVPFPHGFKVDVADALFLVTAQRIARIPLGVLAALRMVTRRVGVATLGIRSASCQAILHQSCHKALTSILCLQLHVMPRVKLCSPAGKNVVIPRLRLFLLQLARESRLMWR